MSFYMEYAGEDTSGASGLAMGNTSVMFGVHVPKLTSKLDLTYEYASWQNAWYVNGVFGDGLTNYDQVLGHWGGSRRAQGDAVGAIAHMAKLIWDISEGKSLTMQFRGIDNEDYSEVEYQKGQELSLEYSQGMRRFITGLKVTAGESVLGENYSQVKGFIRW